MWRSCEPWPQNPYISDPVRVWFPFLAIWVPTALFVPLEYCFRLLWMHTISEISVRRAICLDAGCGQMHNILNSTGWPTSNVWNVNVESLSRQAQWARELMRCTNWLAIVVNCLPADSCCCFGKKVGLFSCDYKTVLKPVMYSARVRIIAVIPHLLNPFFPSSSLSPPLPPPHLPPLLPPPFPQSFPDG